MSLTPFKIVFDTMQVEFIDMKASEYCDIKIEGEILVEEGVSKDFTFTKGNLTVHSSCENKETFMKETIVQLENCLIAYVAGIQTKKTILYNSATINKGNERPELEE